MNSKQIFRYLALASTAVLAIVLVVAWAPALGVRTQLDSPAAEPFVSPLPTPEPLSQEAQIALDYIAAQHNLAPEALQIVNEHQATYPLIGRTFKAFTIWTQDPGHFQEFNLLVELDSGTVEADVNAIDAQERAAYQAKYGKLTPGLYDRLQQAREDELVPIAVWLAPDPAARTQDEIFAALAEQFPGAAEALAEYGVPWAVDNATVAEEIRQAYFRALSEDALRRLQPLADQLKGQGVEVTTLEPVPSLFARLSKSAILALQQREEIGAIYLLEMKPEPALVEAAGTDRMPQAWYQGSLTGAGRRVAVLEPDNIQNTGCLNIVASRPGVRPPLYDPDHKTWVASVLACNNAAYRGIAYNASVIDAGYDSANFNPDFAAGVQWAVQTQNAEIVNVSLVTDITQNMQWEDRVLDWWGRYGPAVISVAAGNEGGNVRSPGKGWNVSTVGAIDDRGNSDWSDDVMWGLSNYINPSSVHGDHEKPDLVAPGVNITMIGPGGNPVNPPRSGTSLAAPQVAGLAALLMNRNGALVDRPEAVKAILMASAVHNIQDSRWMPSGQELRDGAGAIDAALADQAASLGYGANNNTTCDRPCWWATDNLYVAPGNMITRSFRAVRGERIRVAIAWFSNVDLFFLSDALYVNYNLQVMAPSGGQVINGYSASWDNSNELVEFVAPETGVYTIRAIRSASDTSTESNEIGIAWSKQAAYLPDVRHDASWENTLFVRNTIATERSSQIAFSRDNGDSLGFLTNPTLQGGDLWIASAVFYNEPAAAIVDGHEDLIGVVRNRMVANSLTMLDNGFRPGNLGDQTFERAATTLYIPAFYRAIYGNTNSALDILNTTAQAANVTVEFKGRSGYGDYTAGPYSLAAGGHLRIDATAVPYAPWVGSVRILAAQPVVASVTETTAASARSFNAAAGGHWLLYVPAAYKNQWNLTTGLVVHNLGASTTNLTFTFCPREVADPNACPTYVISGVGPMRAVGLNLGSVSVLPNGWTGSVKITSSNSMPLAAVANNDLKDASGASVDGYDFNATYYGGRLVYLPYAANNANGRTTGFTLRNVSGSSITGNIYYYDRYGIQTIAPIPFSLASAQVLGRYQSGDGLPSGWTGSILLEATGPIVAIMREDAPNRMAGYNGVVLGP